MNEEEEEIYEGFKERARLAYAGANLVLAYALALIEENFPDLKEANLRVWGNMVDTVANIIVDLARPE